MHDYSIDKHPKEKILFGLAFSAILIAPLLNEGVEWCLAAIGAHSAIPAPPVTAIPVFGLFICFYQLFNHRLWKCPWIRHLLLVPDLNGEWACMGETTMKNGQKESISWRGKMTITQCWSKILIHFKTDTASSKSVSASIFHDKGVGYTLQYHYRNDPSAAALELSKHDGYAELFFAADCGSGSGNYFTDQHRQTVGTMTVERV